MTALPDNTIAVVVGIETYAVGSSWALDGPALDACRFANWLHSRGVKEENITLLLSPLPVNQPTVDGELLAGFRRGGADHETVRRALTTDLYTDTEARRSSDLLVIYWGGHGVIDSADNRRVLYADATRDDKRNLDITALLKVLRSSRYQGHKRQLVLVDACLNLVDELGWAATPPGEIFSGGRPNQVREQYALFAASPGQRAVNEDALKTGLFSRVVREALDAVPAGAWPPNPIALRDFVEQRFAELIANGRTEQLPSYLVYSPRAGSEEVLRDARWSTTGLSAAVVPGRRMLSYEEYAPLKEILDAAEVPKAVRAIYREVSRNLVNLPAPRYPDDLTSTVEALRNAVDETPLFAFLVLLAAYSDRETANLLWRWIQDTAPRYRVDLAELEAIDRKLQRKVFVLRLVPDYLANHHYQVTVWEYVGNDGSQVTTTVDPWQRDRLAEELATFVEDFDPTAAPVVEFMIPLDMFDDDLDMIMVPIEGAPRPIGAACPVVVRPRERLDEPDWQEPWRTRWQDLDIRGHAYDESAIYFADCATVEATELAGRLCMVLAYQHAGQFHEDPVVRAALGAGTPAMVWHRSAQASPARRAALENVLRGKALRELPELVMRQRQRASRHGTADDHVGRGLVLLWDDPNRVPHELRFRPPTVEGAAS